MSASVPKTNLLTISLKDLSNFLRVRDEAELYLKETLKHFPLTELIENYKKSVSFAESMKRPAIFIEPSPLIQTYVPARSANVTMSLCLDIKHSELYEYDNHRHSHNFSKKAIKQFKLLRKICESSEVYVPTEELTKFAGYCSDASTYKAVEKINSAGHQIGLPDKLLIGSECKGYRINQRYNVTVV